MQHLRTYQHLSRCKKCSYVLIYSSKKDSRDIIGTSGLQQVLQALSTSSRPSIPAVCIGGINSSNIAAVIKDSRSSRKSLDGAAVVSAVVHSPDPRAAAMDLRVKVISETLTDVIRTVGTLKPLSHNMTNLVSPLCDLKILNTDVRSGGPEFCSQRSSCYWSQSNYDERCGRSG